MVLPELSGFQERFRGRCVSCGFLAKHAEPGSGAQSVYLETEMRERRKGFVWKHAIDPFKGPIDTSPVCLRGKLVLTRWIKELVREASPEMGVEEATAAVFRADQGCDRWYPYTPGFDPRWHYEELRMRQLEAQREAIEQQREADRRYVERLSDEGKGREGRILFRVAVIGIILALLEVLAGVTALTGESWIVKLFD